MNSSKNLCFAITFLSILSVFIYFGSLFVAHIWCVTFCQYGVFQSLLHRTILTFEHHKYYNNLTWDALRCFFFVVVILSISRCAHCVRVVQSMLFTWTKDAWIYVMHCHRQSRAHIQTQNTHGTLFLSISVSCPMTI